MAKKSKKKNKTYVVMIADESSSMYNVQHQTISHFNEQVDTIKANVKGQTVKVTFQKFATYVRSPVYFNKPAKSLKKITSRDYCPSGMTALYDAIGSMITRIQEMKDINEDHVSVLFTILTDGQENRSVKWNKGQIASAISELQATGRWTFTFLGADFDVSRIQKDFRIPKGNVKTFSKLKFKSQTASSNASTANYLQSRAVGYTNSQSFYDVQEAKSIKATPKATTKKPKKTRSTSIIQTTADGKNYYSKRDTKGRFTSRS